MKVFLNDKPVDERDAAISIYDHGFLYGDGIFETLISYKGVVFKLDEHLHRLRRSASLIGMEIDKSNDELSHIIYATLEANELTDAYIRVTVTRGTGPPGIDPSLCSSPTLLVMTRETSPLPPHYYTKGIRVTIAETRRNLKEAVNPEIKSLNFLNNIQAKREAKKRDAFEALMLNAEGYITECTVSNIFFVKDSILYTPAVECGILNGITRIFVISLAKKIGITVNEGRYLPEELLEAAEVFITNTGIEILPVSDISDKPFQVGEVTGGLVDAYRRERDLYIVYERKRVERIKK